MKLELPEVKKPVFDITIPIRWGDMDAMGHVNNTVYFRYLETARIEWMRSLGLVTGPATGEGMLIVNAFCNFHRQLVYPGDARVRMYASDAGRTSFETWATIERVDEPGTLYASGGATTVWVEYAAAKAKPLPAWILSVIE